MAKVNFFNVNFQGQGHYVKKWYQWKGLVTRNVHMKSLPLLVRKLWPRLKFFKVGQTSRSLGQKCMYSWKGLVTRNVHMKC